MTISGLATPYGFESFPHFTHGRQGSRIDKIVIHHMDTTYYDSVPGIWGKREASAHYGIGKNGEIRAYVDEGNTAWHSGNWDVNKTSIGIEHCNVNLEPNFDIAQATIDASARLVADIANRYGLGLVVPEKNLFPHSDFFRTACPGQLKGKLQEIADKANAINNGGKVAPQPQTSEPSKDAIQKFKDGNHYFYIKGSMTINDIMLCADGVWRVRINELTAEPFDWYENGIPTILLNRTDTNARDFNAGNRVVFKPEYDHGTIDKYYDQQGVHAVGVYYVRGKFLVWFDSEKMWNHA